MSERNEMWAVQYHGYDGPEVLEMGRAPRPRPKSGEVLVEVAAFSVNHIDLLSRQGKMKAMSGFGFPKGTGVDFAGTVRETGSKASGFTIGDRVWGYLGMKPPGRAAAAAQYLAIRETNLAAAPTSVPLAEAAGVPLAGLTALKTLRQALRVQQGQRVLIVGGNGGVGSTAIQIARAMGAAVDAVTGEHGEIASKAGADRTFDYRHTAPSEIAERYDAVLDTAAVGLHHYRRLLKRGGRIASVAPGALTAALASLFTPRPAVRMVSAGPDAADLARLAEHVDDGSLRPHTGRIYPVDQVVEAHRDAETSSSAGKRVVTTERN